MKRSIRRTSTGALAGVLAASLMLAACSSTTPEANSSGSSTESSGGSSGDSSTSSGDSIKIGALVPLTGDGAAWGPGMQAGAQAAVDDINAAGPPMGRALTLVSEDDGTDADTGVRAATKLISVDKVNAIVGPWGSTVMMAMGPLAIRAGVPVLTTAASPLVADLQKQGTVIRIDPPDMASGMGVGKLMYERGFRRAAILQNNLTGIVDFGEGFAKSFTEAGGEVVSKQKYADGQPDYSTEMKTALDSKPDVLVMASYGPDITLLLKERLQAGSDVTVVSEGFSISGEVIDAVGKDNFDGVMVFEANPNTSGAAYTSLAAGFTKLTGKSVADDSYAMKMYDAVILAALAMKKADSTDSKAIKEAIREISNEGGTVVDSYAAGAEALDAGKEIQYVGVIGPTDISELGDVGTGGRALFVFKDGKTVLAPEK